MENIRGFKSTKEMSNIENYVLFDKNKLAKLYARIDELKLETRQQKDKHK